MLCNLQNTNSQILLTKAAPGNPITDYYQKKEKERNNNSKHFYKHLLGILLGFS